MLGRLGWTLIVLGSAIALATGTVLVMYIDGDLSIGDPMVVLILTFSLALTGAFCIEIVNKRRRTAGSDSPESFEYRSLLQVVDRGTVVLISLGALALIAALAGLVFEQEAISKESILVLIIVDGVLVAGLFWMHRRLKDLRQSASN